MHSGEKRVLLIFNRLLLTACRERGESQVRGCINVIIDWFVLKAFWCRIGKTPPHYFTFSTESSNFFIGLLELVTDCSKFLHLSQADRIKLNRKNDLLILCELSLEF